MLKYNKMDIEHREYNILVSIIKLYMKEPLLDIIAINQLKFDDILP